MVNFVLADAVMNAIEANPAQHDQAWWAEKTPCGTTMCFAGWTVTVAGAKLVWSKDQESTSLCIDSEGKEHYIEVYAEGLLELSPAESLKLFYSCDNFEELREALEEMKEASAELVGV